LHAYFTGFTEFGMFSVSGSLTPFDTRLIDLDLTIPVSKTPWNVCFGIYANTSPVHFEVNVAFGWPTCSFGLI
jgi:hypothetical protein